jgi:hypothetical protein
LELEVSGKMDIFLELVMWVAAPGKVPRLAWGDLWFARKFQDEERGLSVMREVAARVALSRKCRLPDNLHNMVVLGDRDKWVSRYVVMLAAQK